VSAKNLSIQTQKASSFALKLLPRTLSNKKNSKRSHHLSSTIMLSPHRLFLWSLVAGLLLFSPALAQEGEVEAIPEADVAPEQGRRELWSFFSLLALRK
jgi:hypothetical protein